MLLFLEDGGIYIEFVLCLLGGPYLAQPNHGLMFITTNRPIGLLEPFILLAAIFHIVFFCFSAWLSSFSFQSLADLELVRLLVSQTTLAELLNIVE